MTNTYDKKPCPPDCIPGIKCDYCRGANPAKAGRTDEATGAPEKSARALCLRCLGPEFKFSVFKFTIDSEGKESRAIPENPAAAHVRGGDCHCRPDSGAAVKAIRSFSPSDAAASFRPVYLDGNECRAWVISRLHPTGARCPRCGLALDNDTSFREGRRCHCGRCGRMFTATSGTFLEGSHLDYRQVFLLAVLVDLGIAPQRVADIVGVSADTVRLWIKKFKVLEAHGG